MTGLVALICISGATAQEVEKQKPASKAKLQRKWPPLKAVRKSLTRDNIPLLTSKSETRARRARKLILSYGAGAAPVLLGSLSPRLKPELADAVRGILDEIVTAEHAWPLTTSYGGNNAVRNRYVVARLAAFKKKELAPFFRKAAKSKDEDIAELAQFALAGLGDRAALPFLLEAARTRWSEKNYAIRDGALSLKGKEATDWLMKKLAEKDNQTKVAALRLLGPAGTKDAVYAVASYLDAKQHQLRAGAVNALRGIVDGDPPFRHLSVFQAIDEVNKWKRKIGR